MLALKINVWFRTGTLRALVWGMRTETKQKTLHRVGLELIVRVKCYGHDRWNRVSTDGVSHYFKLLCYISLVVDYGGGGDFLTFGTGLLMDQAIFSDPQIIRPSFSKTSGNQLSDFKRLIPRKLLGQ